MATNNYTGLALILGLLAFLSVLQTVTAAFTPTFCSTQNNGVDGKTWHWDYQSNGWCTDKCREEDRAFAIINYKDCWCSDYAPAKQDDTSKCDRTCPGYPVEFCASKAGDRFVYVQVDNRKPSGTKGGPEATSKPSQAPPGSIESVVPASTVPIPGDASNSFPPDPEPTTLQTSASVTEPVTSARIVTVSGKVVTETVVITPPSSSESTTAPISTEKEKSGSNVGAIVGGVVGGVLGLCAIVGGVLFFLWRRRKQAQADQDGQNGINRNTSTMSKAGLIRTEKTPHHPPQLTTSFGSGNKRNSRMMQDSDSVSPVSGSERRSSRPYIFDQRLNPSAIMNLDNTSRGSFASMDDSRDYGRTLNVRNPDPDPQP